MSKFKFWQGARNALPSLMKRKGNLIATEDTGELFIDKADGTRVQLCAPRQDSTEPGIPDNSYFDDEGRFVFSDGIFILKLRRSHKVSMKPLFDGWIWILSISAVSGWADYELFIEYQNLSNRAQLLIDNNTAEQEFDYEIFECENDTRRLKISLSYYKESDDENDNDYGYVPYVSYEMYFFGDLGSGNDNISFKREFLNMKSFNKTTQDE